jgi:hypothetical protein
MFVVLYENSLTWLCASRKIQPSSVTFIVLCPVQSQSMGRYPHLQFEKLYNLDPLITVTLVIDTYANLDSD